MKKLMPIMLVFVFGDAAVSPANNKDQSITEDQQSNHRERRHPLSPPKVQRLRFPPSLFDPESPLSDLVEDPSDDELAANLLVKLTYLDKLWQEAELNYPQEAAALSKFITLLQPLNYHTHDELEKALAQASWTRADMNNLITAKEKLVQNVFLFECDLHELNYLIACLQNIQHHIWRQAWIHNLRKHVNLGEDEYKETAAERDARQNRELEIKMRHDEAWAAGEETRAQEQAACTTAYVEVMYNILRATAQ